MTRDLWSEYRETWETFSRKLYQFQELVDTAGSVPTDIALAEVKLARRDHNAARDRLAQHLASRIPKEQKPDEQLRIRKTAQLIWEFSGKPQNTAEADWQHAEKLLRTASA